VFLVGGFAASNYLFSKLQASLQTLGLNLSRPDRHQYVSIKFQNLSSSQSSRNKAVSEGAVSFHLNHLVSVRVAKWTYGTRVAVNFNESNPEHQQRINSIDADPSGTLAVPNYWSSILRKVCKSYLSCLSFWNLKPRELGYPKPKSFGKRTFGSPLTKQCSPLSRKTYSATEEIKLSHQTG